MEGMKCKWCGESIVTPIQYKGRVRWNGPNLNRMVEACDKLCAHDILNWEEVEIKLGIIKLPEFEGEPETPIEVQEINEWCKKVRANWGGELDAVRV